jgi:hypothetical protein
MIYLYKAAACLLLGFGLMWKATHRSESENRLRFIFGMLALILLALGAATWPVSAQTHPSPTHAQMGLHGVIRSPKCSREGWILTDFPLGGDGRDGAR